jgi:hypothetical protein
MPRILDRHLIQGRLGVGATKCLTATYDIIPTGEDGAYAVHFDITGIDHVRGPAHAAFITVDLYTRLGALSDTTVDARAKIPGATADHILSTQISYWSDNQDDEMDGNADAVLEVRMDSPLDPAFWLQLTLPLDLLSL